MESGEWRGLAVDRERWRSIVVMAGQKLGAIRPHPLSREEELKKIMDTYTGG